MPERLIVDQHRFEELCRHIREAGHVAFDTEFVSEHTYRPELGLLQFATDERLVAVDPYQITDLTPWWELMADEDTTVVVHGGQAEIRFCIQYRGRTPRRLVDVQLAEGLRSRSYPLSYSSLISRVLGQTVHGGETRTDWRRRPLSERQIHYALEDVQHILPVWRRQQQSLDGVGRLEWALTEFDRYVAEIEADALVPAWRRLPGITKLRRRELGVAVELAEWREKEAASRNKPVRRTFRDDLIIELARRQPANRDELLAMRDMNRSDYKRHIPALLECVERGRQRPDNLLPPPAPRNAVSIEADEHVLSKLLNLALTNRCAELEISRQLVGTTADLRDLVRWHLAEHEQGEPPSLATGWRAEVCGDLLTDLIDGRIGLRVGDPASDHPLVFERLW